MDNNNKLFNFFHHWYPLSPLEDLDPKRPTPVTLLGRRLVIWKPLSSDTYRVFLDQCPHRLAPLSEGRIEPKNDNLMCSYHGWQFNQEGICTRIPQADTPDLVEKNKDNFCVVSFPCRQEQDLLWVWPDANSVELAEKTPIPRSPQVDASKGFVWSSFVHDLAYDWQILVENVVDPSHVPFAHHGIQGNRERAVPIPMKIVESKEDLIEAKTTYSTITFEPPCRLQYTIKGKLEGQEMALVAYCIPVAPGKSRIIGQFPRNFAKTSYHLIPRWWDHIQNRNLIMDGDMILLHQQEYYLQSQTSQESWKRLYKLPTSADRLVIEFRQWFDKYCQGKLPWKEADITSQTVSINDNREQLLNRYKNHTQHCSSCRNALKMINYLKSLFLGFFLLSITIVALSPDTIRLKLGLPLIGLGWLSLSLYLWLKLWLEPRFYFMDYIHAEK